MIKLCGLLFFTFLGFFGYIKEDKVKGKLFFLCFRLGYEVDFYRFRIRVLVLVFGGFVFVCCGSR